MTALLAASMTVPSVGDALAARVVVLTGPRRLDDGATVERLGSERGEAACRSRASERVVHMTGVVATGARSPSATHCR